MVYLNSFGPEDLSTPLVPKIPPIKLSADAFSIPKENIAPQQIFSKSDYPTIKRIFVEGGARNASSTMYTVPTNKIFWLIACTLSAGFNGPIANEAKLWTGGGTTVFLRLEGEGVAADAGIHATSISYPIPMEMTAGETIVLKSDDAGIGANATIFGYELDVFDLKSQVTSKELLLFRGFLNIYKNQVV